MTGIQSLSIENRDSVNLNSGSWTQTYSGPMPAQGSPLELIAFLKGGNIRSVFPTSPKVSISFQVFPQRDSKGNTKSRSIISGSYSFLEGDFDWKPIIITLDSFPAEAGNIRVNLTMARGTTGQVYFDETKHDETVTNWDDYDDYKTCEILPDQVPRNKFGAGWDRLSRPAVRDKL